ncbi:MAG TPA: hypothetical protein VHN36_02110 [Ilumatobacteraceae bacterium]|nr:hypothetical protein [Ilumatobacteraceae bacterium]
MKTDPAIEIIEIIDDDDDGFTSHPTARTTAPDGRRRWIGPAAAAALLAVIGYGVISSAISSRAPKASPPTTTFGSTTTVRSTPKVSIVSPQYYVADPLPTGFTMHFAETLGMGGNTADFTDSTTAQLWATAGATANSGSWFIVSRGTHHSTGRNAYRTVAGGTNVVVEHDPSSGQARLSFTKDGDGLEITSFGWADRQLLRLVESVYVGDSAIHFHDPFFVTDHKPLLFTDPSTALYGLPVAWVGYTTGVPATFAQSFTITVAAFPQSNRDVAVRFAMTDMAPITVGDFPGILGTSAVEPELAIVQWQDGDRLITMRGNLDRQQLAAIAQTVRPGATDAVEQQVQPDQPDVSVSTGEQHTVGSGWLDGPWTVQVSTAPDDATNWFVWWIGQPASTSAPTTGRLSVQGPGPTIETLVDRGRTYVLARVPRSMTDAKLEVNPTGLAPVELTFVDVGADLADVFAAYAFTEPVPFTAQIIDGSGQTVTSWPTT